MLFIALHKHSLKTIFFLRFELCDTIRTVLRSFPKANFEDESHPWLSKLQKGLNDILFSKIGKSQRDPALILVAAVIEVSDFEWCLADTELGETDGNGNSRWDLLSLY